MSDAEASGSPSMGRCPPEPILERHLAGELAPDSRHSVHLSTCARCAERLEKLRADGRAYMESRPAASLRRTLSDLDRRAARRRRSLAFWSVALPLAAAAAWLLFVRTPPAGDLTAKGTAIEGAVQLLVGRAGNVAPWGGGALSAGDVLQLSWTSAEGAYVAVVGREDDGPTVRWFPEKEPRAARLDPGARPFGDSLRFDPPFRGTVYVFVGDHPFATEPLEAAVREGREPDFSGTTQRLHVPRGP